MTAVADLELEQRLVAAERELDGLVAGGVSPVDGRDAYGVVRRVEGLHRRVHALGVGLLAEIDRRGLFKEDGHRSARAMVGYAADLSPAASGRRAKAARALRDLPEVAAALAAGRVGCDAVDRIARVHANKRVRAQLVEADRFLAVVAAGLSYRELDGYLVGWERLADEDGAGDQAERDHRRRDFSMRRNLDGSYRIEGGCGGLQGTVTAEIFDAYVRAEFEADWAEARARLGDGATVEDLARTDAQRRMDALEQIFLDAADALRTGTGHQIVTNLIVDQDTFERGVRRGVDAPVEPDGRLDTFWSDLAETVAAPETEPIEPEPAAAVESEPETEPVARREPMAPASTSGRAGQRCSTIDGHPLDPAEVVAATLVGYVRRVVLGADSVVVNMGRKQRLFTGPRQLAVMLSATTCPWPGCSVPNRHCQSDHLQPWGEGGRTDPSNGAPGCGKHNRHRNHGYTVRRDEHGRLHVHRPDGTEIT